MRLINLITLFALTGYVFISCGEKQRSSSPAQFTKADSLTDVYLKLQDTLHQTWNIMINDDNQKINAMHNLLHELMVTHPDNLDEYSNFEERLEQLTRMRYTQKSMANTDVVEEYDFASNSLVVELIAAAEAQKEYTYNTTLQKLVANILLADQRTMNYRFGYDSIVYVFNNFVERNHDYLLETDHTISLEKKPQFQMVAVD